MNETVNQEQATEERKFTQAELDAIVGERLNRERAKYADYETIKDKATKYDETVEASKTELQRATERASALEAELNSIKKEVEVRDLRAKVASEKGVPIVLLNGDTEEACIAQADAILSLTQSQGYPTVRDAGEVAHVGKTTTKQQFAEWADKAFG